MKILIVLFLFSSCNVMKVISGDAEVDTTFFDTTVFSCNGMDYSQTGDTRCCVSSEIADSTSACFGLGDPCAKSPMCDPANNANATAVAGFADGDGTAITPYLICNINQLQNMQDDLTAYYELGEHIDGTSFAYTPVATCSGSSVCGLEFTGSFHGNSCTISNVSINRTGSWEGWNGIFGQLGAGSTVSNVRVLNITINSGNNYNNGGIAGRSEGATINDVYVSGTFVTGSTTGGIVGQFRNNGTITRAKSNVTMSPYSTNNNRVGGIVGDIYNGSSNQIAISEVGVFGTINAGNSSTMGDIGGVIGNATIGSVATGGISITNAYNHASVSGPYYVGGVVGRTASYGGAGAINIDMTFNGGSVGSDGNQVGGLVGGNATSSTQLSYSFNTGIVTGSAAATAGWVIGYNSPAMGSVTGIHTVGGGTPTECYGTGTNVLTCTSGATEADFYNSGHAIFGGWDTTGTWSFPGGLPILQNLPKGAI